MLVSGSHIMHPKAADAEQFQRSLTKPGCHAPFAALGKSLLYEHTARTTKLGYVQFRESLQLHLLASAP